MARTFRQRRQMHAVAELNVTNLLDLAFVLLIIFMRADCAALSALNQP